MIPVQIFKLTFKASFLFFRFLEDETLMAYYLIADIVNETFHKDIVIYIVRIISQGGIWSGFQKFSDPGNITLSNQGLLFRAGSRFQKLVRWAYGSH
jgi:hypothetical protein